MPQLLPLATRTLVNKFLDSVELGGVAREIRPWMGPVKPGMSPLRSWMGPVKPGLGLLRPVMNPFRHEMGPSSYKYELGPLHHEIVPFSTYWHDLTKSIQIFFFIEWCSQVAVLNSCGIENEPTRDHVGTGGNFTPFTHPGCAIGLPFANS